ncbi:hypothetical protein CHLRE_16g673841v5 [Chlamydomonas reinhardtii]|uniref:SREBP regulating gene protein n=1 Tax=Chlamydomonas reinhardtii TaxID=3055 RepID=A8J3C2_CHLRE|nr:uncharacterized protein CHLRE_16g673841v5 [Chlamydomonas reinhardtii]PNW72377.1 hypothetical protein CHLRE_16g673841v5 [Chlamydomonas reinhardtii]|eukprot:XP_001695899.1 predicted membrane-anchored protein [Chlamydomonas reinhardtii]
MGLYGALVVALMASLSSIVLGERRLFIRDLPEPKTRCRNTVQGLNMVTDDHGVVCKRSDLSYSTGCCTSGNQHDCALCDMRDRCCSEYESCVSCCLAPQHNAVSIAKQALRSPRHKDSGFWGDPFEYCKGICRTHSRSTAHENAYISSRHHCFSQLGRPMLSDPLPAGVMDGVEVVTGQRNANCDDVCAAKQKKCSADHLRWLSSCDRLREQFGCEAGCEVVAGLGPSYVDGNAPKPARPAMCFAQPAEGGKLSCSAREEQHLMLCPCK